jgi:hypothetical protein
LVNRSERRARGERRIVNGFAGTERSIRYDRSALAAFVTETALVDPGKRRVH